MFHLLKLTAYMLLGYVVYELVLGITESQGGQSHQPASRPNPRQRGNGAGGSSRGRSVTVEEPDGARRSETVGRGVVS